MTKAQEIYRNMKKRGRIYKSHGKWGIKYSSLYVSIKEAGYNEAQISRIIENMLDRGYIRQSRDVYGRTATDKGLSSHLGNFVIEKWEN